MTYSATSEDSRISPRTDGIGLEMPIHFLPSETEILPCPMLSRISTKSFKRSLLNGNVRSADLHPREMLHDGRMGWSGEAAPQRSAIKRTAAQSR